MALTPLCCEVVKFSSIGNNTVLLQLSKVDPLTAKVFNGQSFFTSNSFSFLFFCTPLHGLVVCGLAYSVCLLFSYLSHALLDFGDTFYLMHTLQIQQFSGLFCYLLLLQSILYIAQ